MNLLSLWNAFLKTTQYGGAIVSLILNSILILLILFRSPPNLGNYKYLMLYIVVFQIIYSAFDVITEPTIISYGPAFYVIRNFTHSAFNRQQSFCLIVIFCSCFGVSIALFAIHFIYRYGAFSKRFRDKYLSGKKLYLLFATPVVFGTIWATLCVVFFQYDESTDRFAKNPLLDTYDIRVEDISYAIVIFYQLDEHNEPHPDPVTFLGIGCMWCLISASLFCVLYFGVKCYQQLSRALACARMVSKTTKSLQKQLFLALVVQTAIPVVLMYIPFFILYFFPMINVNVGSMGSFIAATVAIYPAIDPLPTMFIIKSFRNTLFCRTCGSKARMPVDIEINNVRGTTRTSSRVS